ncbi:excinuclease ABC subunit UvrC [Candidatus Saccharibacteria bacterium]|nr:excinuclease ABC subunit UvrC [Candidatus Saccharibacteria bacterium]NCU40340.1 excinuclease ABC subunit UvrC [Candidatus Saccharibacteria bacterium]
MNHDLENKLKELPKEPGIYFHKNATGDVIYVGKAANLRNRVRQYFQASRTRDLKTEQLISNIADTDWMVVDSEIEALFLEAEMVRRYMPPYNILLRDDKSLSYIRIDIDSDYPTVSTTRQPQDDGARYFGPYFSLYNVRQALRLLRRIFPYATKQVGRQKRASLQYYLGLDPGLESGKTSVENYRVNLRRLIAVIEGKKRSIVKELEKEMHQAATEQEFEKAAQIRNQLRYLKELGKQIVFSDKEFLDLSKDQALTDLANLLGLDNPPARIEGYDISHLSGTNVVASMVVFTNGVSDRARYRKFKMSKQINDDYASMREALQRRFSEKNCKAWGLPDLILIDGGSQQLQVAVDVLDNYGLKIPAISISKRNEEVVVHRLRSNVKIRYLDELKIHPEPGVFVRLENEYYFVNLHVGQLNAGTHSKNLRGGNNSRYSDITKLFQRVRDESHRFAVSYHETLRRSGQLKSRLEDIPGVGDVIRKKLIKKFGSINGVKKASLDELQQVVGLKTGQKIYDYIYSPSHKIN